jgi:hypothetical protein
MTRFRFETFNRQRTFVGRNVQRLLDTLIDDTIINTRRSRRGYVSPGRAGALGFGPLKAAVGVADATPHDWGRLKAAGQRHCSPFAVIPKNDNSLSLSDRPNP